MTINDANIYNFNPDYIGERIAEGDWSGCWEYLYKIIENLTSNATSNAVLFSMQLQENMRDEEGKDYARNFGALLGELFLYLLTNPDTSLSDKNFQQLIFFHETLHTLFYIHNIDNTDAAVQALLTRNNKPSSADQKKILLLLSLESDMDIVSVLKAVDSQYRVPAYISYLSYRKIFRKDVYENKSKLISMRSELDKSASDTANLTNTTNIYFLSSYLDNPDKHSLKENINTACRQYLTKISRDFKRIRSMDNEYNFAIDPARPTILIVAEVFAKSHAMYRGWGKIMKALHKDFNVVFSMPQDKADMKLSEDYPNFAPFKNLGELYHLTQSVKPDILFMPSVGMRFYNIILSNMRVAPIQMMGLGHPATSMSDYVDYVVSPGGLYDPAAFPKDIYIDDGYPEKHTALISKEQFFSALPSQEFLPFSERKVLRVGVVGSDIKVAYPFFRLLKEIVESSNFEIEISFIVAAVGIDSLYIEKYLAENFSNSVYYGWQPYEAYVATIKKMDIVLNPFPFGHTNTVIDTLMCGKPFVGMEGIEPASKTEGDIVDKVGLKNLFIAHNEEEYKAKFFALAERIINGETVFFDRDAVYNRIYDDLGDYDYSEVINWIYQNNDAIKNSGKKFVTALGAIQ